MATISQARYDELLRKEQDLLNMSNLHHIQWIGDSIGKAYAISLANKSWAQWTDAERQMLRFVCGSATAAKNLYIQHLPK